MIENYMSLELKLCSELKELLFSEDLTFVKQGLALWESLIDPDNFEDFTQQIFQISQNTQSFSNEMLHKLFVQTTIWSEAEHSVFISLWILGSLALFSESKARSIDTLSLGSKKLGELPDNLANITDLSNLYLDTNLFQTIPSIIEELSNLLLLDINHNYLKAENIEITLPPLLVLDISGNDCRKIPDCILQTTTLKELFLSINYLSSIPSEIENLSSLIVLDLSENDLSSLPDSIQNLQNLSELYLGSNLIKEVPPALDKLSRLKILDLSFNYLHDPVFSAEYENLTRLNLTGNHISHLPASITKHQNLKQLFLSLNIIQQLPSNFHSLENIEELHLNQNQLGRRTIKELEQIFPQIAALPRLSMLNLSQNYLSELVETDIESFELIFHYLSQSSSIRFLDLQENSLPYLPSSIVGLESLRNIRLYNNNLGKLTKGKLRQIITTLSLLPNLEILNLVRNNLRSIPDEITNASGLQFLNLRDNRLTSLPSSLQKLDQLCNLELGNNALGSLSERSLQEIFLRISGLPRLTLLGLAGNQLSKVPAQVFDTIFQALAKHTQLKELNVFGNQLQPEQKTLLDSLFPDCTIRY